MRNKQRRNGEIMRSAVFHGKHDLRIENIAVPEVRDKEVLIKVMACGICGTDVHIFEGDKGAADCPPGTVLGHEFSGIVEAVGNRVTSVKAGDRVCVDPNKLCGECCYCKNGTGHFCESMIGIGTTVNGGFSEYCAVPESQVYKISDEISFEEAAMAEPVACCLHGLELCNIKPGSTVMVLGGGMIGLIMLQLSRLSGAVKTVMVEPVAKKRELARELGAYRCIDPFRESTEKVLEEHHITQLDTVIECVGLTSTIESAIRLAGKNSTVMMFGLTKPDDTISVKPFELFKKEITLKASFINPYTQARAVSLICEKKIDVKSMVRGIVPLEELAELLSDGKRRSEGKYIISPWKVLG